MSILDIFKNNAVAMRKYEEKFYSIAAQEMADGRRNEALWLKALEQADGNEQRQLSIYIGLRVQSLQDEHHISIQHRKEEFLKLSSRFSADTFVDMIKDDVPLAVLEEFVSANASGTPVAAINLYDSGEEYPLHAALKRNRLDVAEWLLRMGASTETANYWGKTAFDVASSKGSDEAMSLVLKYDDKTSDI